MRLPRLILSITAVLVLALPSIASASFFRKGATLRPPAVAAELTGDGENMEIIGNLEVAGLTELELAGDHAFLTSSEGLAIVNIADPRAPFLQSLGECAGGFGDVDINATATVAALGTDGSAPSCAEGTSDGGTALFDITDKSKPVFKSYIAVPVGSHTQTIDYPYVYINNYDPEYRVIEIYDISDLAKPKKVSQIEMNGTAAHDSYVDHRPDGKVLLYSASVASHDVVDVTKPDAPVFLQKVRDNQVTISHQTEPNYKRDMIIATDEYGGGAASGICGKSPTADATYQAGGQLTGAQGTGFVHFYRAAEDGTYALNGADKAGTYNVPITPETGGCTAHVFWTAPDQNRMTIGWYHQGSRIVDFSDLTGTGAKELGWFLGTGGNVWATKPHNGYVFASDMNRGLDIMRYTGEGGTAWPATSEPAEVTRLRRIGAYTGTTTTKPAPPAQPQGNDNRTLGTFRLSAKLKRVPGKRGKKATLTFTVKDSSKVVATKLRFKKKVGRNVKVSARGTAVAGKYTYEIRVGDRGKVLKRGRFTVKPGKGSLPPNVTLVCRVR